MDDKVSLTYTVQSILPFIGLEIGSINPQGGSVLTPHTNTKSRQKTARIIVDSCCPFKIEAFLRNERTVLCRY